MLRFEPVLNISEWADLVDSGWKWNQTKQKHLDPNQQNILTLDNWPSNSIRAILKKEEDQLLAVVGVVYSKLCL